VSPENDTVVYRLFSPATGTNEFIAITLVPDRSAGTFGGVSLRMEHQLPFHRDTRGGNLVGIFTMADGMYNPNTRITVSLNNHIVPGGNARNMLHVDYYRVVYNGDEAEERFLGTLEGTQSLTIFARDYGVFVFRVRDMAGNAMNFSGAVSGAAETRNYATLVNLARPPLYISERVSDDIGDGVISSPIIDGMIYNDGISLRLTELPFELSSGDGTFATRMEVFINGVLDSTPVAAAPRQGEEPFRSLNIDKPGNYRVVFSYRIEGATGFVPINNREFNFVVVPRLSEQQSFSFIVPRDTEVTSIRLGTNEIRGRFPATSLRQVTLNSSTGMGTYVVTIRQGTDNIHQEVRVRTFRVRIGQLPRTVGIRAAVGNTASMPFGFSTRDNVSIMIDSNELYRFYGAFRVFAIRDNTEIEGVGRTFMAHNLEEEEIELFTAGSSDSGQYRIYITAPDAMLTTVDGRLTVIGDVFASQGFMMNPPGTSPLGVIIILVVVALVVVAAIFFIRLRMGMRTK
jgi:hypothetical protein